MQRSSGCPGLSPNLIFVCTLLKALEMWFLNEKSDVEVDLKKCREKEANLRWLHDIIAKNRADLNQYWWSCEMMNREFLDWVPPPYSDPVDVQLPHIFCTPLPQPVPHTRWFYSYWHKHSTFTYSCMMSAADSVPCCSSKAIFSTSVSIAAMTSRWQRSTSQLTRRDREAMTECTSANCVV